MAFVRDRKDFSCQKSPGPGEDSRHSDMKIRIKDLSDTPVSLMRRAGYVFQRQENEEMSFVRVFAQSGYPRFHCYTRLQGTDLYLNLHLDQKKHTYGESTRHHGEYEDTGIVGEEAVRLIKTFGSGASIV